MTDPTASKLATKITFEWNGTEYTMEFDRDTVAQTEKVFDVSMAEVNAGKITAMTGLFYGSFLKHHPNIKASTLDAILNLMPDKVKLFRTLTAMYIVCVNSLLEDSDEGKTISWTAV
ncbi:DUF5055 domain-containing protein [Adlercreutzia sp. ZJ242]|uniref:DUF5055 domain-containing protein n=1 Tax=Adlercreutzia sp. ZJ242 TaxID=2709409 RepID=UPI0013EA646A|nr:DUF5055 domain-containing protein [Adlercreutzia sp. ZJ242]